jgi:DNA topoisomerase-1
MAEVLGTTTKIKVKSGKYSLEAKGEVIKFEGWYKIGDRSSVLGDQLPKVDVGEVLKFISLEKLQKFTQGPARYNDASLIKALEELGIGRPSTYAPTLSTIADRQYVEKNPEKRYQPTALGEAVNTFLVTNFADTFDYGFTAKMEDELDEVANGNKKWQPVIHDFWDPFSIKLDQVQDVSERVKVAVENTGEKCPKCVEGDVIIRLGKFGKFLACSRFPECDYKANYQNKTGTKCEKCLDGDVILRKTRTSRNFYGCSNYPKCDFASWNKPASKPVAKV